MRLSKILGSAIALALTTIVLLSAACGGTAPTASPPPASPASKAQPSSPATKASSSPSADQAWQQEYADWEKKTYEAAKKEGKVVGYGFWSPENERIRREYFSKKYPGIELETLTTTTAAEKLRTEKETGNVVADFYLGGGTTPYTLNQLGLTEPFLPPLEKEPGAKWVVGPSLSTTYPQLTYAVTGKGIMINTDLVPPAREPKAWKDLLDPFWANGKITLDNPARGGGPGPSWFRWADSRSDILGRSFIQGLAAQKPVLFKGSVTPALKSLVRGEYYAVMTAFPQDLKDVAGGPGKFLYLEPETQGTTLLLALIKNAPHPNAAKLFLNMHLSKEFQEIVANEQLAGPVRLGIQPKNPLVSNEGRKIYIDQEKDFAATTEWSDTIGKQIFGP